jgi:hypothetical protein
MRVPTGLHVQDFLPTAVGDRVLRELRAMGLLTVHRSEVTIHNLVGLKESSGVKDSDIYPRPVR